MTKTAQDFEMWSGDHRDIIFTVTDTTGASKDLTGASVVWVLAAAPTSGSLIRRTTDAGEGITVSGCTFTVSLSPAHTSGLSGYYYHEAQVRDSASNTVTVTVGTARIRADLAT